MNRLQIGAKLGRHPTAFWVQEQQKVQVSCNYVGGSRIQKQPQEYFSALPVRTDLVGNDATMRPERGVSIRYPYKVTSLKKKKKKGE